MVVQKLIQRFGKLGESFCTGCRYCLEYCPEGIQVHLYAGMWNQVRMKLPIRAYLAQIGGLCQGIAARQKWR